MKTKLVYVLVSDFNDIFLERNYVSVYSARKHNPRAFIILVTDKKTMDTCKEGYRNDFLSFFNEVKVIDDSAYDTMVKRSRFLKTTLPRWVKGDFLYIDADTVICGSLDAIDQEASNIEIVIDGHYNKEHIDTVWTNEEKRFYGVFDQLPYYFNGGVIYAKESEETKRFFDEWYKEWEKNLNETGVVLDQPPLHQVLIKQKWNLSPLDGIWNTQVSGNCLNYINKAKILHLFNAIYGDIGIHKLCEKHYYREIKQNNGLTNEIIEIIESPKESFRSFSYPICFDRYKFMREKMYQNSYSIWVLSPLLYNLLSLTSSILNLTTGFFKDSKSTFKVIWNKIKNNF